MIEYHVGKQVRLNHDGKIVEGEIVCIYVMPSNYDLIDVQTEDGLLQGVSTEEIIGGD